VETLEPLATIQRKKIHIPGNTGNTLVINVSGSKSENARFIEGQGAFRKMTGSRDDKQQKESQKQLRTSHSTHPRLPTVNAPSDRGIFPSPPDHGGGSRFVPLSNEPRNTEVVSRRNGTGDCRCTLNRSFFTSFQLVHDTLLVVQYARYVHWYPTQDVSPVPSLNRSLRLVP